MVSILIKRVVNSSTSHYGERVSDGSDAYLTTMLDLRDLGDVDSSLFPWE